MTDRELLELAARAAGIALEWRSDRESLDPGHQVPDDLYGHVWKRWDPLLDDGDALRLMVKLHFCVCINHMSVEVECWQDDTGETRTVREPADPFCDYCAATRRAIVRAAAALAQEES